jgi:hypothetical protein
MAGDAPLRGTRYKKKTKATAAKSRYNKKNKAKSGIPPRAPSSPSSSAPPPTPEVSDSFSLKAVEQLLLNDNEDSNSICTFDTINTINTNMYFEIIVKPLIIPTFLRKLWPILYDHHTSAVKNT